MPFPLAALAVAQFAAPLVTSLVQGGKAKRLSAQADKANAAIPLEDPQQAGFLSEVRRRQRALDAGTDPMTAARTRAINNAGFQTQMNVLRAQSGPGAVSNILRAQKGINAGLQDAGAQAASRADQYTGMIGNVIGDMSKRRYALQSYQRDKLAAEAAAMRQGANENLMAAIAAVPDVGMDMAYNSFLKGAQTGASAIPSGAAGAAGSAALRGPMLPQGPSVPWSDDEYSGQMPYGAYGRNKVRGYNY